MSLLDKAMETQKYAGRKFTALENYDLKELVELAVAFLNYDISPRAMAKALGKGQTTQAMNLIPSILRAGLKEGLLEIKIKNN